MIISKKLHKIIFILLLIIACEENSPPTVSNNVNILKESDMGLYGWHNNKYQINLHWKDGYGCDYYDISIDEFGYEKTIGPDIQTYHYITDVSYNPGHYFTADVKCSEEETEYFDSVILNTTLFDVDPSYNGFGISMIALFDSVLRNLFRIFELSFGCLSPHSERD